MKQTRFLRPLISLVLRFYSLVVLCFLLAALCVSRFTTSIAAVAPEASIIASRATDMGRDHSHLGGPPELQDALSDYASLSSVMHLPASGVFKLFCLARKGHGDYTWGYKIYRTTYRAGTDVKLARAIGRLEDWMRDECLNGMVEDPDQQPSDSRAREQLAQRLRNEIVEDRELLDGASTETLLKLHQEWVHLGQEAVTADSPCYRFFLAVDDEVLEHLLKLSEQPDEWIPPAHIPDVYSIKVYDARHNSPTEFSDWDHSDSEGDDELSEYENPSEVMFGFEGWWASASKLAYLWLREYDHDNDELVTIDYSWGGVKRFIHSESASGYLLDCGELRDQDQAGVQD